MRDQGQTPLPFPNNVELKWSEEWCLSYASSLAIYNESYLPASVRESGQLGVAATRTCEQLKRLSSEELSLIRKERIGFSGDARALSERILRLRDGREVIAGARFKNLDRAFPFIEVTKAFELTTEVLEELRKVLPQEFARLTPIGFKFTDRPSLLGNFEIWSHSLLGELAKERPYEPQKGLNFEMTSGLDWYDQYRREYEERLIAKHELQGFVRIAERTEFEESAAAGALMVARDDEGFAGVFAAIREPLQGLDAMYMVESFLSPRWIGRGAATLAHGFLYKQLATKSRYIWGTIYDRNQSSLKTARRMGRKIIETEYFVRF